MRVVPVESKQLQPRPPVASAAKSTGTTRPTVRVRRKIRPLLLEELDQCRRPSDPYVRRFWTAAMGPGAVADLLRLIQAARAGRALPLPDHLPDLVRVGLAAHARARVWVLSGVPNVPVQLVRRLPPHLRREHAEWLAREGDANSTDP